MTITIKKATIKEIMDLSCYIPAFYEEFGDNPFGEAYNYDQKSFVDTWVNWISQPNYCLFCAYDNDKFLGGIGGMFAKHPYTKDTWFGYEHFWYVIKEYRKQGVGQLLINTFEDWLKQHNVKYMIMVYIHGGPSEQMANFYEKAGFRPFETQVLKEI